jgi:hypothetical protein
MTKWRGIRQESEDRSQDSGVVKPQTAKEGFLVF